jgi:hypothetical protein
VVTFDVDEVGYTAVSGSKNPNGEVRGDTQARGSAENGNRGFDGAKKQAVQAFELLGHEVLGALVKAKSDVNVFDACRLRENGRVINLNLSRIVKKKIVPDEGDGFPGPGRGIFGGWNDGERVGFGRLTLTILAETRAGEDPKMAPVKDGSLEAENNRCVDGSGAGNVIVQETEHVERIRNAFVFGLLPGFTLLQDVGDDRVKTGLLTVSGSWIV